MPTGYTAALYEGEDQTFPEFALRCARGFGALILMRDESPDAEIPEEFPPSSYHRDALVKAEARLAEVLAWTDADAHSVARHAHAAELEAWEKSDRESTRRRERYERMLAQARAWEPPTPNHEGLRSFMVEQLRESIGFDCHPWPAPPPPDLERYRDQQLDRAYRDVEYHREQWANEQARTADRNKWARELRESLA